MKVSIVMANYNRRQLLINTLKTIEYYNLNRKIEVIIVDDNSSPQEDITDIPDLFNIPVIVIPITKAEKRWTWDGVVFNIGFSFATGDVIIIQNPENLHVGDIIGYALKHLKDNVFLSFGLYSMDQKDSDDLIEKTISKGIYAGKDIIKAVGKFARGKENWKDGDTCWYNHSIYRPSGCHLISAIKRSDLEDLHGFDERYSKTFAYSDAELKERIVRKGMDVRIIDFPFAIHQRHELSKYQENEYQFLQAGRFFNTITRVERNYRAPRNIFYHPRIKANLGKENHIEVCPISGEMEAIEFLDLGTLPLVNNLCDTKEESLNCGKFPLSIQIFPKSRLTTLADIVDKDNLFLNYMYESGVNKPFLKHCADMYDYLSGFLYFKKGDLVLDVGGNDGSLLLEFKKKNEKLDYINIDASRSFIEINARAGISYVNKYFDEHFLISGKKATLITSTNVFQHTLPIRSFVRGIYRNLTNEGLWCLEFPYLLTTLFSDNYDQVYHEHIFYYLLSNIVDLLKQEGMKVVNVSFYNIHAGTLRVLSAKQESKMQPDQSVDSFLNLEKYLSVEYCIEWGKRMHNKIREFREFFDSLKEEGKVIYGFGAAAKGCVFLNSIDIDYNTIPYIIDDTPFKQDKFMPGTGIQIKDRSILKAAKVDYILILAHNFKEYIINSLKGQYDGEYIVMFPYINIIQNDSK
jgi:glycosyltransferase involved in cell wall biosynthesis